MTRACILAVIVLLCLFLVVHSAVLDDATQQEAAGQQRRPRLLSEVDPMTDAFDYFVAMPVRAYRELVSNGTDDLVEDGIKISAMALGYKGCGLLGLGSVTDFVCGVVSYSALANFADSAAKF